MSTEQPALFTALPPKPKVPGRLRTNEEWLEQQPELYQEIRDRIMGGDTNVSELARLYAPQRWNSKAKKDGIEVDAMRRAIKAMVNEDITMEKFREIVSSSSTFLAGETVDKASELAAKATSPKELGAMSMAMNMAVEVGIKLGGTPAPVIRHEHVHVHTTPDALQQRREMIRAKLAQKSETIVEVQTVPASEMVNENNASS